MKRIVVVSDSHGQKQNVDALRALVAENDLLIHLGDGASDVWELKKEYPEKIYVCRGNCDFNAPYPLDGILEIEWLNVLYCHGHAYGVKEGFETLVKVAKERGCEVVLYGHTHQADIRQIDGITFINPGTLRYSLGKGGSYAYVVIHKDKCTPVLVGECLR